MTGSERYFKIQNSTGRKKLLFALQLETGKQKVVLFYILGPEQTFLGPEIAISGVFVSLNQQQSRRQNSFSLDKFSCCGDRFIFTTLKTKLGDVLKNPASFLTAATFTLASPGQIRYLLLRRSECRRSYKRRL
jgi:hypothetical protein